MRIGVLKGVAWGPNVETGANVPSDSGGLAADRVCLCYRVSRRAKWR
jgi:hypothetical protein